MSPAGVEAALAGAPPVRTAFSLFNLANRVAVVTGGHRGIGLELALAFAEVGAIVYCLDLPNEPDSEWLQVQRYAANLPKLEQQQNGRLEYMSGDVTDQKSMWAAVETIVEREGRIDVCVANAGIAHTAGCLDYPADGFRKVSASSKDNQSRFPRLSEGSGN
jgi:NAD(P)-dependent dehydrogenase (short-subunit alcohol dehydrogenase family)